jgi:hypothetical protein
MVEVTTMRVVVKHPNQPAVQEDVDVSDMLAAMQKLVGGYVQAVKVGPNVVVLCDEDGLAKNKPDNCGFVGSIVFVEEVLISPDEGYEWGPLSDDNLRKAVVWCQRYGTTKHPDRSGSTQILFGDEAIKRHQEAVAQDMQSKMLEWQSL